MINKCEYEIQSTDDWEIIQKILSENCSFVAREIVKAKQFLYHGSAKHEWNNKFHSLSGNYLVSSTRLRVPYNSYPNAEKN